MINPNARMSSCREGDLKNKLKAVSFALYETVLYLDGHPDCQAALAHYNALVEELEELTGRYEDKYGPLTIFSNNCDTWAWVSSPWPWESEAN